MGVGRKMVVLLLALVMVGTLTTYAQLHKEPNVECVNVLREIKPVNKTLKETSAVEMLVKTIAISDIRSLVKPWEVDYRGI